MKKILLIFSLSIIAITGCEEKKENVENSGVFKFRNEITLPGSPVELFDAATGDISGWWDHSFSENPLKFYIEPKPGGGFYEIFDTEGNGVKHADVIYAKRGELLRFEGPLGLSGRAVNIVTSYYMEPVGTDSTLFSYEVHGSGEVDEKTAKIVEGVWEHFILDRFAGYINEGSHKAITNDLGKPE